MLEDHEGKTEFKSLIPNKGDSRRARYKKEYQIICAATKSRHPYCVLLLSKIYKAPTSLEIDPSIVTEVLDTALKLLQVDRNDKNIGIALKYLRGLHGVELPVASAFLHFYYPDIPIIDKYSFALYLAKAIKYSSDQIQKEVGSARTYSVDEYLAFRQYFNREYREVDPEKANFVSMRDGALLLRQSAPGISSQETSDVINQHHMNLK